MDVFNTTLASVGGIPCVDLHTSGGPVRIPVRGLPALSGTLQQQLVQASSQEYDWVRKKVLLEPRGHADTYGAILRPETELTLSGEADIGILFMNAECYMQMCGHVTFAVARFLVDTHDLELFPKREKLHFDESKQEIELRIHAPCGLLRVTVPALPGGRSSDPTRKVSFISVPAFASALDLKVEIPVKYRWAELQNRTSITVDISFGGLFFVVVSAQELGFINGLRGVDLESLWEVAKAVREIVSINPETNVYTSHPDHTELLLVDGVLVTDQSIKVNPPRLDVQGVESAINFTAHTIDRSPCGSGTAARVAVAYARGTRKLGENWAYNCLLSLLDGGKGAFIGTPEEEIELPGGLPYKAVTVKTEGAAFYSGAATFISEDLDMMTRTGFDLKSLPSQI